MRRAALALLGLVLAAGCAGPDPVTTYRVAKRDFVHRVTAEGNLEAAKVTVIAVPQQIERRVRIAWLAPDGAQVAEGDVIARFDPGEMEERLEQGQTDLAASELEIDKAELETGGRLAGIEKDRELAGLELEAARKYQKRDGEIYSRHEIIESEIDEKLAIERETHSRELAGIQKGLNRTELELLEIGKRRATQVLEQAREALDALEVRAPHAGVLSWIRDWQGELPQVGAQVWRGQQLAEIPDLDVMQAEVFVLEADAGGLAAGKPAAVVVEAHPETVYQATISRVDSVAKPRFRGSPVQYFGVTLTLEATHREVMKPGQRVRATLLLDEREAALVVPRQAVFQDGGETRVLVRNGSGFEPRAVAVGASSLGLVTIDEGLTEGEVISLEGAREKAG